MTTEQEMLLKLSDLVISLKERIDILSDDILILNQKVAELEYVGEYETKSDFQ